MEQKISRRTAIKRMGAAAAGLSVFGTIPTLAEVLAGQSIPETAAQKATAQEAAAKAAQQAQKNVDPAKVLNINMPDYKLVYEGPDVVFHQINDHLWVGNGHLMYNESVYIVEGSESALLIDTGTKIDHLDEIVAGITKKPVKCLLTHNHSDHAGSVKWFKEIWVMNGQGVGKPRGFSGKVNYIENHQIFDLGGIEIEAFFTPGHTTDSVTFINEAFHYAISGDAFGSSNLLMTQPLSTFIKTAKETLQMMNTKQIYYMLPGHFDGQNAETSKRVFDLLTISEGVLAGKLVGESSPGGLNGINRIYTWQGVRFNYNDKLLK